MIAFKIIASVSVGLLLTTNVLAQTSEQVVLPNGWQLSPAGKSFPLGDLPLNMEVSPSSKYIAVTNNGKSIQTITMIDVKAEKKVDSIVIKKSWYGLQFAANEKFLYASCSHDNQILKYELRNGKLALVDSI